MLFNLAFLMKCKYKNMAELFSHDFKNAFPYWIIWEGRMQRKKCSTVQLQNSKL